MINGFCAHPGQIDFSKLTKETTDKDVKSVQS